MPLITAPKGVPDYVPPASAEFVAVRQAFARAIELGGYSYVELPVFEDTQLYVRGVGQSTDVVSKEMYTFEDRGGRSLTLRPEGTAGVTRAVLEHGLERGQLPVKLYYMAQFFRAENPQAGRFRQFHQVGTEVIGTDDPALDAENLAVADSAYRSLGLTGYRLELTTLGDQNCRPAYRDVLQTYLRDLPLDEETRRRVELNPLRVLDDKRPEVRELTADAPLMIDHLCPECRQHYDEVKRYLGDLGVKFVENFRMVRGLDYYTRTTFEFVYDDLGSQSGIGGGGRYDALAAELGGPDLPATGFALGVDRTVLACRAAGLHVGDPSRCDVFCVPLGAAAKDQLMIAAGALRAANIRVDLVWGEKGLKGGMKAADRSGARYALVMGERDLAEGVVQLKELSSGDQRPVPLVDLVPAVHEALALPGSA